MTVRPRDLKCDKPMSRRERRRVEKFIIEQRAVCDSHETWQALRRVLAALRGDWKEAE